MSVYTEYELRCDVGMPANRFACDNVLYGATRAQVLADGVRAGWDLGRVQHRCPEHPRTAEHPPVGGLTSTPGG